MQESNALYFGSTLDDLVKEIRDELGQSDGVSTFPFRKLKGSPTRSGRYKLRQEIPTYMMQAINQRIGFRKLFDHQLKAWDSLTEGKSVILTTPTASGKTMAFNPAVVSNVMENNCSALYIYPLVDLATSQFEALELLSKDAAGFAKTKRPRISCLYGSVDKNERIVRKRGEQDFVLTTPDTLHKSLLSNNYPNWKRFFGRLRFVVVDEAHIYNGVFGTNMAFIIRRLLHRCFREGNKTPQFIICSATIREPKRHAKRLTSLSGDNWDLIDKSTTGEPGRYEIALVAKQNWLVSLFTRLLSASILDEHSGKTRVVRTILFVRSRAGVSQLARAVKDNLIKNEHRDLTDCYAGYMAGQRRGPKTFQKLLRGELKSIITTNKLMAGIDIGEMDVSIVYGFQGRFMDMRQMFGRAARRGPGAWIFIGSPHSSDDQFIVDSFPDVFECKSPERCVVDLKNTFLQQAHIKCLAANVPSQSYHQEGPYIPGIADMFFGDLIDFTKLPTEVREPSGAPWREYPFDGLQLRGSSVGATYKVYCDGVALGEEDLSITEHFAFRDYHPEAIFMLEGRIYKSKEISTGKNGKIIAQEIRDDRLKTRCHEEVSWKLLSKRGGGRLGPLKADRGVYLITTSFTTYDLLHEEDVFECPNKDCNWEGLEFSRCPTHNGKLRLSKKWKVEKSDIPIPLKQPLNIELQTRGVAIDLEKDINNFLIQSNADKTVVHTSSKTDLLFSFRNAVLTSFEDAFLADGNILNGLVDEASNSVIFYDEFPGGIGIAEVISEDKEGVLLEKAFLRISRCGCKKDTGCASCVSPFRKTTNSPTSKRKILLFIKWLLTEIGHPASP